MTIDLSAIIDRKRGLWYLSFADPIKFWGAAIVDAPDFEAAIAKCDELGVHPGGQVAGFPIEPATEIDGKWLSRLLTRAEVDEVTKAYADVKCGATVTDNSRMLDNVFANMDNPGSDEEMKAIAARIIAGLPDDELEKIVRYTIKRMVDEERGK